MLEHQREGIAAAKAAAGRYKGRAPTALARAGEIGNWRLRCAARLRSRGG